jgi:glycosyltransferase involved in cell wall biosynthesis
MHELVLASGIDPGKVHRIPIGVDLENFPIVDEARRTRARRELEIPTSAFLVGSFVKDGVGFGEGYEPKLVKGPDTLLAVLDTVRASVPELFVLLTGPARGYVRSGLEQRRIPHRHVWFRSRDQLAGAYHTLDVSLVASRQEGGPKTVLESMATGAPLVTTRVGQASELVVDGETGLLADVDDVDALAAGVTRVRDDVALTIRLRAAGRTRAEQHAEERLDSRWAELLEGFVHKGAARAV